MKKRGLYATLIKHLNEKVELDLLVLLYNKKINFCELRIYEGYGIRALPIRTGMEQSTAHGTVNYHSNFALENFATLAC